MGSEMCIRDSIDSGTGENIYILGDSITAGFGLKQEQAYPYLLSQKINLPVVNRGVSGDRTADGLARLSEDVLVEKPWLVIVALGGNDFLKKVPKTETEQNLTSASGKSRAILAVSVGMRTSHGFISHDLQFRAEIFI